jgi:dCTP diphosphatase
MRLEMIQEKLRQFVQDRDWGKFHTPKNLAMSAAIEAAELMEIFQWLTGDESHSITSSPEVMEATRQEIADVLIYTLRLADVLGIDVEAAILHKISMNESKYPVEIYKGRLSKP